MKMNSLVDRALHPGALRGLAGRRAGRPQRARHLLPAARRARGEREHPRGLGRRPLPRALARLRASSAATSTATHRLGRPDAAQPRHPRGAAGAGRVAGAARPSSRTRSSAASPTTPSPGSSSDGRLDAAHRATTRSRARRADASAAARARVRARLAWSAQPQAALEPSTRAADSSTRLRKAGERRARRSSRG